MSKQSELINQGQSFFEHIGYPEHIALDYAIKCYRDISLIGIPYDKLDYWYNEAIRIKLEHESWILDQRIERNKSKNNISTSFIVEYK